MFISLQHISFRSAVKPLSVLLLLTSLFAAGAQPLSAEDGQRIICWGRGNSLVLDFLYMFPEAPAGVTAVGSGTQSGGSILEILDPHYADKAVLEMELQPETAAALAPTAVVLKSYMRKAAKSLERLGLPVLFLDMESPEAFKRDLAAAGELFGNRERADELSRYFDSRLTEIKELSPSAGSAEKPEVLFVYYSTKGGTLSLKVPPAGWIQTKIVEWAGGRPVWTAETGGTSWTTVSFEQIARWNPEKVFVVNYHGDSQSAAEELAADPLWRVLRAGKNGGIHAVPADFMSWDQSGPRWILGLSWAAHVLQPARRPLEAHKAAVYDFFSFLYGMDAETVDAEIIPRLRGDHRL